MPDDRGNPIRESPTRCTAYDITKHIKKVKKVLTPLNLCINIVLFKEA